MSLPNENESLESETSVEPQEDVQRAAFVIPLYSIILIVCLVGVFLCQIAADARFSASGISKISTLFAGFVKPLFNEGQYWRILTGAALHGGFLHLFFNSYALYSFGNLIETLSNRAHLAIVFFLSVVGGGILSLIFLPDGNSVGASGGVVGLLGYMTVYAFKRRRLLPDGFLKNMLINIGVLAFVGVFILPNIDNFAHLGGLLVGILYGFVQISGDIYKDPRESSQITKVVGFAALGVFILTAVFSALILLGIIAIEFPTHLFEQY